MTDRHHHFLHYVVLFAILFTGLTLFIAFRFQPQIQWIISLTVAGLYVLWGIGHHSVIDKHMHARIVVEYVLMSLVGLILLWGVLPL